MSRKYLVIERFELVDTILDEYSNVIGCDRIAYQNHVYRMINCINALGNLDPEELNKVQIAAAFHDIGIWTKNTVDYIEPSVAEAQNWMQRNRVAGQQEILDMIEWHHKISAIEGNASRLPELFRQGDLVDFSLGLVKFSLPGDFIKSLKGRFPNAGFHKMLLKLSLKRLLSHPLDPAPMMRR